MTRKFKIPNSRFKKEEEEEEEEEEEAAAAAALFPLRHSWVNFRDTAISRILNRGAINMDVKQTQRVTVTFRPGIYRALKASVLSQT